MIKFDCLVYALIVRFRPVCPGFWGAIVDLNLPLDPVLKNGLIEITYKHRRSDFNDPIIQKSRSVTDMTPNWLTFKLRQDFIEQKFSWGAEYFGHYTDTDYLVDEVQTFTANKRLRLFVESTRFFGLKTQFEITQLNNGHYTRSRFFYENDRSGAYTGSEISQRTRKPQYKLSIWGTF